MAYCTAADVFRVSGLPTDGSVVSSTDIDEHILDAQAYIDEELHTSFETTAIDQEIHDGHNRAVLYTRFWPIITIDELKVNDTTISSGDYVIYKERGAIAFAQDAGQVFYVGQQNIDIDYNYGYTAVPRNVESATAYLAAIMTLTEQLGGTFNDITGAQVMDVQYTKGEPAANIQATMRFLDGLVGKTGWFEKKMDALKRKHEASRILDYDPHWGWGGL